MPRYCPACGASVKSRERRINGDSTCVEGHKFPSACELEDDQRVVTVLDHLPDRLRPFAHMDQGVWVVGRPLDPDCSGFKKIIAGLGEALMNVEGKIGPLAIAVPDHHKAEALAHLFCAMKGPYDQGVIVVPFGASVLSYTPGGTMLFRALLIVPPRDGPIAHNQFMAWVDNAFTPYLAPLAAKVIL